MGEDFTYVKDTCLFFPLPRTKQSWTTGFDQQNYVGLLGRIKLSVPHTAILIQIGFQTAAVSL